MTIAARPTIYRGIQMRSRLEARVAAWLDSGDPAIDWEYEPRAFADRHGQYLPDFVIRRNDRRIYMEVKPTVEKARPAIDQMTAVLESDPAAILCVIVPDARLWLDASIVSPWSERLMEFGP